MARKVLLNILIVLFAFIAFPITAQANAVSSADVKELIVKHSMEMGMDPALALSIAKKESNFKHSSRSKYGAIGVFQLMPNTAKRMGYNPYHLNDNIKGGITYYKMMYKMFGKMELALAAYNAGPGNVKKYNGIPPFAETKRFVSVIMSNYKDLKANPDPAIVAYEQTLKEINEVKEDNNIIEFEDQGLAFRQANDAILKAYLANQGI
jgi:soluble lytic murein transglycosylase-like protein